MSDDIDLYEGDTCPICNKGEVFHKRVDSCSCHISPPCGACVDAPLVCDTCSEAF